MLKIGLTGGIGSGKSTIAKVFETLGIPVYNADDETRRLMNTDEGLKQKIIAHFGEESYKDGCLNRKYVADAVFNNPEKLTLLNAITHPVTIAHANGWMARQISSYTIKEAALLFESGSYKDLDFVIGVSAPLPLRLQRVQKRDGLTNEEIMKRINRQMNEEDKIKQCDFLIINDENHPVIPQVLGLDQKFRMLAAK